MQQLLAIVVGASFAAGLNVYATTLTLGLLAQAHALQLPPALHAVQTWPVIAASGALFTLEFVADKIPVFDLLWNALHTFVRVPVAAMLSYGATQHLSPVAQIAAAALGGLIALASHSGKTAIRAAVTPSPEPFSNMALSFSEDVAAVSLTWFATRHPVIAAIIVIIALVLIVFAIRWVVRSLKRLFSRARARFQGDKRRSDWVNE
ncbi:MAG: DUF4126 domain-containing protein [Candidatus Angelobacter sp. Gp1-AA117]|nr:MAG: DUF4126 domain-containing protein [Candidatus Angelobacter sp. Gp1-AA117]